MSVTGLTRESIGFFTGLFLFLILLVLPAPEGLSPVGMRMAAVGVLMAVWWLSEATHIAVTSLLPIALFPLLGIMKSQEVTLNYANHLVFLYVGGFIIALAMERWDLHKRIALFTIRRVGTKPSRIVLGFMATTGFLSLWMSNTAVTMMLLPVSIAVVNQLAIAATVDGIPDQEAPARIRENFGSVLLLGVAYAASIGGVGTIIGSPTNVAFLGFASQRFPDLKPVSFLEWAAIGVPLVAFFLPIAWFYLCRFGGDFPVSRIRFLTSTSIIDDELAALGPMKPEEKKVLVIACATALLWIFREDIRLGAFVIPGWSSFTPYPGFIHDATVAMALAILLCVMPIRKARRAQASDASSPANNARVLIDWSTIQKGIPWGVVFLFGGGFALAQGLETSGLAAWIGSGFGALRGFPLWILLPAGCLLAVSVTEVTSNVATVLMLAPILAEASVQLGVHPYLLMLPATIIASFAFMLPVATPPNAIVFSSGWITIPRMFRAGAALDVMALAIIPAMIYFLGRLVLGIG
ncbi:MAG: SLC13 family permease [Bryobacteraceae bacterium]|nr:SLC13 family permease [Bryobacteraceae bacterium]